MASTCRPVEILVRAIFLICLVTAWPAAAQQPEIATTVAFTEGPAVDRDGNVYFTDICHLAPGQVAQVHSDPGRLHYE